MHGSSALLGATESLTAWLEAMPVALLATDHQGKVLQRNARAEQLLGPCGQPGDDWLELLQRELGEPLDLPALLHQRAGLLQLELTGVGGPLRLEFGWLPADAGCVGGGVWAVRRLDEAAAAPPRALERLAAVGGMVMGFAHEVRNPLASLRLLTESLHEMASPLQREHTARQFEVLERLERLVRSSLQLGRPATVEPSAHAVWSLLSQAVAALEPRLQPVEGQIRVQVADALPWLFADPAQLLQILVVLLDNALDASASPDDVSLAATLGQPPAHGPRGGEWVAIAVTNHGPGIARSAMPLLFEPFYTTKRHGTGLGLPIAQQLARDNGARIEVSSRRSGPTVFTLTVPAVREGAAPPPP